MVAVLRLCAMMLCCPALAAAAPDH
eukprot:SAG31_NODE_14904_length_781_cov_1.432551_1_plen_24_part_10